MKTSILSRIFISVFIVCQTLSVCGQAPVQSWAKEYPVTVEANAQYTPTAIVEETDGFVISGYRSLQEGTNPSTSNIFAFKIDKDGDVLWFNNYDIANPVSGYEASEEAHSMVKSDEGNYYITGFQSLPAIANPGTPPPQTVPCTQAIVLEIRPDGTQGKTFIIDTGHRTQAEGNRIVKTAKGSYLVTGLAINWYAGSKDRVLLSEFTGEEADTLNAVVFPLGFASGSGTWATSFPDDVLTPNYVIAGTLIDQSVISQKFDMFIMNSTMLGSPDWEKTIGGEGNDYVSNVVTQGDNLFLSGYSEVLVPGTSYRRYQVYLHSMDMEGNTDWTGTYGGAGNFYTRGAVQVADGNLVAIGHMEGNDHKYYPFFLKVNSETGDSIWYKQLDANGALRDAIYTSDFDYLVAGKSITSSVPSKKVWVVKMAGREGVVTAVFPRTGIELGLNSTSDNIDVITASDLGGNLYGVSVTINELLHPAVENLEIFLEHGGISVKLVEKETASGANFINTTFMDVTDLTISSGAAPYSSTYKPAESLSAFNGSDPKGEWTLRIVDWSGKKSVTANGTLNSWTLKLLADPGSSTSIENTQENTEDFMLAPCYPNPLNTDGRIDFRIPRSGHVSLTVYNLSGQRVQTLVNEELTIGDHTVIWNVQELPSGTFFLYLESNGMVRRQKVVVI